MFECQTVQLAMDFVAIFMLPRSLKICGSETNIIYKFLMVGAVFLLEYWLIIFLTDCNGCLS
jgi:hypothetical protein